MEAAVNDKAKIWRDRIEAQRASGQSVRAWCVANGSREHSFFWWRARLGLSLSKPALNAANGLLSGAPFKRVTFARVVVRPSATEGKAVAAEALHLRLAGGRELILPASMPLEQVAKLVRLVEATA